jgi:hypothetical protein
VVIGRPLHSKIACPFHRDNTPSLHIFNDHYHCFGCNAHGDTIDWLVEVEGKTPGEAVKMLADWDGPTIKPITRTMDDDEKAERDLARALRIWNAAVPIAGTIAERYLRDVRKIDVGLLPASDHALRFSKQCTFGLDVLPRLVARYSDVETDEFAGVHRICLTRDVFAGAKVQRQTLGRWSSPRAVKLWSVTDRLFLGEGVETTLAAATRYGMRPAWAAVNAANMADFPIMSGVKLTLLVDHDPAGQRSADECWHRWRVADAEVDQIQPDKPGADFNDLVLEQFAVAS